MSTVHTTSTVMAYLSRISEFSYHVSDYTIFKPTEPQYDQLSTSRNQIDSGANNKGCHWTDSFLFCFGHLTIFLVFQRLD